MVKLLLGLLGYRIEYVLGGRVWETRYGTVDHMAMRPIHNNMSTAPPRAKVRVVRVK